MSETRKLAAILVADVEQRATIFQPNSNWEATCVTAFEQYWRLRYRFG